MSEKPTENSPEKKPKEKFALPRITMICDDGKERTETLPQAAAYQIFRSSGGVPGSGVMALIALHPKVNYEVRTVYGWKKRFLWEKRVKADKKPTSDEISNYLWGGFGTETISGALDDIRSVEAFENEGALAVVEYSRIIRLAIKKFAEDLEAGRIKTITIADMERLARLDKILHGEGEESHTQINIITGIPRPPKVDREISVVDPEIKVITS